MAWRGSRRAAAVTRAPSLVLPAPGTMVAVVRDGTDLILSTTVERVGDDRIVLVPPTSRDRDTVTGPCDVQLTWPTLLGIVSAEGELSGVGTESWVVVVHRTTRRQRRSAVRVRYALDGVLQRRVDDTTVEVTVVDLSEAGVACIVPASWPIEVGEQVEIGFTLPDDGASIVAEARVARAVPARDREAAEDGVRFGLDFTADDPVRSEHLGRFAFDLQMRRR